MHGAATESGDSRLANKWYKKLDVVAQQLREQGPQGEQVILRLLESGEPYVRLWAASYALAFSPSEAQATLEALATYESGLLRLTAATTLSEWRKNN